mmetsp:Transcript_82239/g.208982  ORF Transcript_82239/g.208982 Transcript_82239/m.208982 type:complete len:254 (-) Transcript_82239:61-822(-)
MAADSCFKPRTHLREVPLEPAEAALVVIDVQNFCCHPEGAEWRHIPRAELPAKEAYFWEEMPKAVSNIAALLKGFREKRIEVLYTTIESLTRDGRDRSLDYKISGFNVPRGSWDGKVLDEVAPLEDEIVLPKTSCSVFVSTNLPYILRNLGVRQVVLVGGLTDQCVESAIRDACDMGFLVTQVTDACYTISQDRHDFSMRGIKGFCRQRTAAQLLQELAPLPAAPRWEASGFREGAPEAIEEGEPCAKRPKAA